MSEQQELSGCFPWPHHSSQSILLLVPGSDHSWFCVTGLSLAAPFEDIYSGLWGFNSSLACIAIGGMFMALTWQTHLLALACGEYSTYGVEEGCPRGLPQSHGQALNSYLKIAKGSYEKFTLGLAFEFITS